MLCAHVFQGINLSQIYVHCTFYYGGGAYGNK